MVFCDLRGFTAFAETSEPEEVMAVLNEYHQAVGRLIHKYEATLERFAGDGINIIFNDPLPCPDPPQRAVRMAVEMRDQIAALATSWRKLGHELGFGIGSRLCHTGADRLRRPLRLLCHRHRGGPRSAAVR